MEDEIFGKSIDYFVKNAKAFGINKKYIGIWGGGHPGTHAFDAALDKLQKYHKYIKCAVFEAVALSQLKPYDKGKMSKDVPLLFITGTLDQFRSSHTLFLEVADEINIPIEYIEYEGGGHNWYKDGTDEARDFVQKELDYFKSHLLVK
jgi:acetyl esterase/lipase